MLKLLLESFFFNDPQAFLRLCSKGAGELLSALALFVDDYRHRNPILVRHRIPGGTFLDSPGALFLRDSQCLASKEFVGHERN